MVILFTTDAGEAPKESVEFIPGPLFAKESSFLASYEAMAARAGLTLQQAVEKRYCDICKQLEDKTFDDGSERIYGKYTLKEEDLRREQETIGIPLGQEGSSERLAWFEKVHEEWLDGEKEQTAMQVARSISAATDSSDSDLDAGERDAQEIMERVLFNRVFQSGSDLGRLVQSGALPWRFDRPREQRDQHNDTQGLSKAKDDEEESRPEAMPIFNAVLPDDQEKDRNTSVSEPEESTTRSNSIGSDGEIVSDAETVGSGN